MEIKYADDSRAFQDESKEYFVNILSGRNTLHKKNCCYYSKCCFRYYDFDSLEEAKNSGIELKLCGLCKRKGAFDTKGEK